MVKIPIREVAGLFIDKEELQSTVDELLINEFDRRHLSVMGSEKALESTFGTARIDPKKVMKNPETPRTALVDKDEMSVAQGVIIGGGMLSGVAASLLATGAVTIPGTAVTAIIIGGVGGATIGAALAKLIGNHYKEYFEKQIEAGGLLLWVRTPNEKMEEDAIKILKRQGGKKVQAYTIKVSDEPEQI